MLTRRQLGTATIARPGSSVFVLVAVAVAVGAAGLGALLPACVGRSEGTTTIGEPPLPRSHAQAVTRNEINPRLLRRFRRIAQTPRDGPPPQPGLVSLGRMLWYETRLSRGGQISCNTCHTLGDYGVDHHPVSVGDRNQQGRRNSPTAYNTAEHISLFWDGRARDAEQQAPTSILNPAEMAATREGVERTLRAVPEYARRFHDAFPADAEPVTIANVARCLAAFERGLVTRSRWDDYLSGKREALSSDEIDGLRVFLDVGCMSCHTGPQVGASMLQVAGFVQPWLNQRDLGRYEVTGVPADRMVFKVPTLKNVTKTSPYFHDGSCADLGEAVRLMGRHQLGIELSEREVTSIVTFFGALTGELPHEYIAPPALPPPVLAQPPARSSRSLRLPTAGFDVLLDVRGK
jgi:cytochrome c peroxidase